MAKDVLLRHPTADARPRDLSDVHVMLGRDLADNRRRALQPQLLGRHLDARLVR
jgi:hypothetical protein